MKTTRSINISGSLFTIDDDAYILLESYLKEIEIRIKNSSTHYDTYEDIENRVSEIFNQIGLSTIRVVTIESVREVIKVIGSPEIFGDAKFTTNKNNNNLNLNRQLFRDPRSKTIGGVCSGLGSYLNIDPTIIKILFIIAFVFGGSGLLAYIIIWIVIPQAKSVNDFMILDKMKSGKL